MEAAGIEDASIEQRFEALDSVSPVKLGPSAESPASAESVLERQKEPRCHTVTALLDEALRALDAGRVDLARDVLLHLLGRRGG